MLGTDDNDLSYLLVQASTLFDRNEWPNMELGQMHVYSGYFHNYHRKHALMDDQVCGHEQAYLLVSRHFQDQKRISISKAFVALAFHTERNEVGTDSMHLL